MSKNQGIFFCQLIQFQEKINKLEDQLRNEIQTKDDFEQKYRYNYILFIKIRNSSKYNFSLLKYIDIGQIHSLKIHVI